MIDDNLDSTVSDAQPKRYADNGAHGAQPFADKAQAFADRASEAFGTGSERFNQFQQEYGQRVREQVRAKPLAAIGVAVAVGLLASKLFRR